MINILTPKHVIHQHNDSANAFQPKTKAGLLSLRMFFEAMKVTAIYDKYEVNAYLMGTGLSVAPEYRRQGIAVELLSVRWVKHIYV